MEVLFSPKQSGLKMKKYVNINVFNLSFVENMERYENSTDVNFQLQLSHLLMQHLSFVLQTKVNFNRNQR